MMSSLILPCNAKGGTEINRLQHAYNAPNYKHIRMFHNAINFSREYTTNAIDHLQKLLLLCVFREYVSK